MGAADSTLKASIRLTAGGDSSGTPPPRRKWLSIGNVAKAVGGIVTVPAAGWGAAIGTVAWRQGEHVSIALTARGYGSLSMRPPILEKPGVTGVQLGIVNRSA